MNGAQKKEDFANPQNVIKEIAGLADIVARK